MSLLIVVLLLFLSGCEERIEEENNQNTNGDIENNGFGDLSGGEWETEQMILQGNYCDAEIIKINDTHYRLYYCIEPEVEHAQEMHSAVSTDGITWDVEEGIRMMHTTFPDIITLPDDSGYRMYHQGAEPKDPGSDELAKMGTVSSFSTDGLVWELEEGFRLTSGIQGTYDVNYASDTSTVIRPDGSYFMVYRGESGERLDQIDDVKGTPIETFYIISAHSENGIDWEIGDIVVDTSKPEFDNYVLGPELVYDEDVLKLYFFGIWGIYEAESHDNGETWEEERKVFPANQEFAPSDPTLIKMGETWRMYYGIHLTGLYSATLIN